MSERNVTRDEAQALYDHLLNYHNIDKRWSDVLAHYELPYVPFTCEHDIGYVVCLFCSQPILVGNRNTQEEGETCTCVVYIEIPDDLSGMPDAASE